MIPKGIVLFGPGGHKSVKLLDQIFSDPIFMSMPFAAFVSFAAGFAAAFVICAYLHARIIKRNKAASTPARVNDALASMINQPMLTMVVENSAFFKSYMGGTEGRIRIDNVDYLIAEIDHTANELKLRKIGV